MNVLLQRHCAKHIYVVPDGLKELMSDISREVLRHQPENIYVYVADYLDALMITRENARVAARLVQSISEISETTCDLLMNAGMSRAEADEIVANIQQKIRVRFEAPHAESFLFGRRHSEGVDEANFVSDVLEGSDLDEHKCEHAARIIQTAFKKFRARREREKELLSGMIDWRVAARSAIRLYKSAGVTNEEAQRAATLIKAAYKGYYTRKMMRKIAMEGRGERHSDEELDGIESEEEVEDQDGFYGYESMTIDTIVEPSESTKAVTITPTPTTSTIVANMLGSILEAAFESSKHEEISEHK